MSRKVQTHRPDLPLWAVTEAARRVVDATRRELEGEATTGDAVSPRNGERLQAFDGVSRVEEAAERLAGGHPRPVVNATGVVLHTNLGRAPLAPGAARAAAAAAAGYSDLELDLSSGGRGDRLAALADKLSLLS